MATIKRPCNNFASLCGKYSSSFDGLCISCKRRRKSSGDSKRKAVRITEFRFARRWATQWIIDNQNNKGVLTLLDMVYSDLRLLANDRSPNVSTHFKRVLDSEPDVIAMLAGIFSVFIYSIDNPHRLADVVMFDKHVTRAYMYGSASMDQYRSVRNKRGTIIDSLPVTNTSSKRAGALIRAHYSAASAEVYKHWQISGHLSTEERKREKAKAVADTLPKLPSESPQPPPTTIT